MANIIYNSFIEEKAKGNIDWINDDLQVILMKNTYTPNKTHEVYADVITHEITPGGAYSTGGKNIDTGAGRTVTVDGNKIVYDGDDVEWTSSIISAYYAIIYKYTGTPSTGILVACFDFGGVKTTSNETFKVEWSAFGIITEEQAV